MLLRFEGPAGWLCQLVCSSAAFENYTASNPHDLASNARVVGTGITPATSLCKGVVGITVKIVRAHGGCLGTWSR